ncbi:MAG: hypothetical protein PHV98_00720 [Candidatus Omnitrophica bacterium]|nr:hypothetical protein [Candidatus Omnitrophota bacterium]
MTAYGTVTELKARTQIESTDASRDTVLGAMLDAAKVLIDQLLNHKDGFIALTVAVARYFPGSGKTYQWIDECVEISSVAVKDSASDTAFTAWTTPTDNFSGDGDWIAFAGTPQYPSYNVLPYTGLMIDPNGSYSLFNSGLFTTRGGFRPENESVRNVPMVKVTAKYGYSVTAPALIKEANLAQASRWYKKAQSAWADTLASAEMGTMMYTKKLDPDIETMLMESRYYRPMLAGA